MQIPSQVIGLIEKIKSKEISAADETARTAAKIVEIAMEKGQITSMKQFEQYFTKIDELLFESNPTSASLRNCCRFIKVNFNLLKDKANSIEDLKKIVISGAKEFLNKIIKAKERIGIIGSKRFVDGDVILTHSSSTSVLSILNNLKKEGKEVTCLVTESRPKLEGVKMAKEISKIGFPVSLILDSSVRFYIHECNKVLVGAEAITANGAIISKIGTSQIALVADEARVRVDIAAGTYKFYPETVIGQLIDLGEGPEKEWGLSSDELMELEKSNINLRNPLFDVTPPEFIDLFITEKGIIPPQGAYILLRKILEDEYGFKWPF